MDFEQRRRLKWLDGRQERGLSESDEFCGDPILEALGETPDLANYIDVAIRQRRIPADVGRMLIQVVAGLDEALSLYQSEGGV